MKKQYVVVLVILITGFVLLTAGCTRSQPAAPAVITPDIPLTAATHQVTSGTPAGTITPTETYTTNETLVAFVREAVTYVKENGKEKALAEFSDPKGSFIRGELYIYAYDFNGTTLAHPVSPEKIGVNRMYEAEGGVGLVVQNMSAIAKNKGAGFYRFTYINPAHNRTLESKLGYTEKVDEDWWLGSGVYSGPVIPE